MVKLVSGKPSVDETVIYPYLNSISKFNYFTHSPVSITVSLSDELKAFQMKCGFSCKFD